ncbi:MAG: DUF2177 family protein [Pseudomonadota bacterium]
MAYVVLYLVTAVLFLGLDLVWISQVAKPLFEADVPHLMAEEVRLDAAGGFYLLYVVGILYFASARGLAGKPLWQVALDGALFGFFAYGTYEATNFATLDGWTVRMAVIDIAWGTSFTSAMGVAGLIVTRALFGRRQAVA